MQVSSPKAVLDACVIFPAVLRDTLLRAAEQGLYEVYWSDIILEEASRNLVETGRMSPQQAQRLLGTMRQVFPDATLTEFESLIADMTNDQKDRHVLAATVKAGAQAIATSNLQDFPDRALASFNIEAQSPDEFLMFLFDLAPLTMIRIVNEPTRLRQPPMTVGELLDAIALQAPQFASLVRQAMTSL